MSGESTDQAQLLVQQDLQTVRGLVEQATERSCTPCTAHRFGAPALLMRMEMGSPLSATHCANFFVDAWLPRSSRGVARTSALYDTEPESGQPESTLSRPTTVYSPACSPAG